MTTFRPVRAVAVQMRIDHLPSFVWFWAILAFGLSVFGVLLGLGGAISSTAWHEFVFLPSKYFLMVMAIITASVYLPVYVGHGVTRRHFALGAGAFFGLSAVAFGAATLAGNGLVLAVGSIAAGLTDAAFPMPTVTEALLLPVRATLVFAGFICTGWLLGASFYRFGAWGGIALIPAVAIPGLASDFALGTGAQNPTLDDLVDLGSVELPAAVLIGVISVTLGVVAAHLLVRNVAIRKVTG